MTADDEGCAAPARRPTHVRTTTARAHVTSVRVGVVHLPSARPPHVCKTNKTVVRLTHHVTSCVVTHHVHVHVVIEVAHSRGHVRSGRNFGLFCTLPHFLLQFSLLGSCCTPKQAKSKGLPAHTLNSSFQCASPSQWRRSSIFRVCGAVAATKL